MKLPIAKDGLPFIAAFAAGGAILLLLPHPAFDFFAAISFALALFCVYFFRDPDRPLPNDPAVVVAPGDGVIMEVTEEKTPYSERPMRVVKIFLSVFDVHVQKAPISGTVLRTEHKKGKFYDARDPRACFENEYNDIVIQGESMTVVVKQIAGLIARRIICWTRPGHAVRAGERVGLIRFGSQVDLFLPLELDICVGKGDRVASGVSVIAVDRKAIAASKGA